MMMSEQKKPKNPAKTIIIVGMHRSGTSLVAGLCHIVGICMGFRFLKSDRFNPKGYFEDAEFVRFHIELLEAAGGSWSQIPSFHLLQDCFQRQIQKAKKLVESRSQRDLWGWKDPRTSLFLELWIPLVKNPHVIVCWRNPLDVARSLESRDKFDLKKSLHLCYIYSEKILTALNHAKVPTLHVIFEKWFQSEESRCNQLRLLSEFLKISFDNPETTNFIQEDLRWL